MAQVKNGIRYEMLSEQRLAAAIECVSYAFTKDEPMVALLDITLGEFRHFANAYYPSLLAQELSFVAIDEDTDRVIGVRISEDFHQEGSPPEIPGLSPKFFPLFGLLDRLSASFKATRTINPGQYVHMFMIAVEDGYQRRGIAPEMNRVFFRHVKKRGYLHAVTEPTGLISQHILKNKFGFEIRGEILYQDFEFEGTRPFADLVGHPSVLLMEKDLSQWDI